MKKNISLIIGLAIPIVLVVVIALVVYIPQMLLKPAQDFLYVVGQNKYYYSYGDFYSVINGKLEKKFVPFPSPKTPEEKILYQEKYPIVRLFVYNSKDGTSREVVYEEASSFNLSTLSQSSDGFTFAGNGGYYNNGIFEIFGSSREPNKFYLKKGNLTKKIELSVGSYDSYYGASQVEFLSWIK